MNSIPKLEGDAKKAVKHRGSPLQIIASAGSGKREVVAQRVADLFSNGANPEEVVAFTFTDKAAEELKLRIEQRVEKRMGSEFVDRLNKCYIGTIHSYSHQLLRQYENNYGTYDILDEHRLAVFLIREKKELGLENLPRKLFESISDFNRNMNVVENELISISKLEMPFRDIMKKFYKRLHDYRLLTYGRMITLAAQALKKPKIAAEVIGPLRYLIVDEYQDINLSQETLIKSLASSHVELCVVGDDDQSIYQWRGSDVSNIVKFDKRYKNVKSYKLLTNHRSRPQIIRCANRFAETIPNRISKKMRSYRPDADNELVFWKAKTEDEEADIIARNILRMTNVGYRFQDIAVLVRSSTSYNSLLAAFRKHQIPVQSSGRTGMFKEQEAQIFGQTFAFLVGMEWRLDPSGESVRIELDILISNYSECFHLDYKRRNALKQRLARWKNEIENPTKSAEPIRNYYNILSDCGVSDWDMDDPIVVAKLGIFSKCSTILSDYEIICRRARQNENQYGEVIGGQDRGIWFYRWLFLFIQNWAVDKLEGFEGEESFSIDAVNLTTIHKAKGLEWPIVFIPCVSAKRFPSSKTGKPQNWYVPKHLFGYKRYQGTDGDERRLFYVAITRARDWLSISTHDTPKTQIVKPSPYLNFVSEDTLPYLDDLPLPNSFENRNTSEKPLSISLSELEHFNTCGYSYRLRRLIGFKFNLVPEIGYGRAVHYIMRQVAEYTRRFTSPPNSSQLDKIFDDDFYLPAANNFIHYKLKTAARILVDKYISDYGNELHQIWELERLFELKLSNVSVRGQTDVILDEGDKKVLSLAAINYKTGSEVLQEHERHLQLFASAGRREGLDVRAAYIHDLDNGKRDTVDLSKSKLKRVEKEIVSLADNLFQRKFDPKPGLACKRCDVKPICKYAC